MGGFGIYLDSIDGAEELEFWFRFRNANIAVNPPAGGVILDFDKPELYYKLIEQTREVGNSYTEKTPRGGFHVFVYSHDGIVPRFEKMVEGLELKSICMVYPSIVKQERYIPVNTGHIIKVDLLAALRDFGTLRPLAEKKVAEAIPVKNVKNEKLTVRDNFGIIAIAKRAWPILPYLAYFEPKLKLSGKGIFKVGLCPFHNDNHPSLWVNGITGLWGCHACGAHGDVINWHALRLGTDDQRMAARDLARYQVTVEV